VVKIQDVKHKTKNYESDQISGASLAVKLYCYNHYF